MIINVHVSDKSVKGGVRKTNHLEIMNYHTLFLFFLSLFILFQLKFLGKREAEPSYLQNFRKLDKMKVKNYEFFDLSKKFNGDKAGQKIQETRRKRIDKFCRNREDENKILPSDQLRFTKYGGFFCSPDTENWLTKFSDLIKKNLSRLEFSFKKPIEEKRTTEIQSFILTEDPIRRFLKYYHFNARIQR